MAQLYPIEKIKFAYTRDLMTRRFDQSQDNIIFNDNILFDTDKFFIFIVKKTCPKIRKRNIYILREL